MRFAIGVLALLGGCASADNASPTELDADVEEAAALDAAVDAAIADANDAATPDARDATTNDCPRARVAVEAGKVLNIREAPNTTSAIVGTLPNNAVVPVKAEVTGEAVSGNTAWLEIEASPRSGFVSAVFAKCTTDAAPVLDPPAAYRLPLACGTSARISQGNGGTVSHSGRALYAFDFAIAVNTPLVAMADGIVLYTFAETEPGEPCYNGGGSDCYPYANYVVLRHGDGTGSIYKHLNKVLVAVGEFVPSGKAIGLSGSTGYSTGPHAHVMRQESCGAATSCQSVAVKFADVPGSGVPVTGQTVKSGNCP